ncbi:hypothetical protein TNCV_1224081 [Trichonephila clavipes]|nr:hypothetical protein TNCV_1224081 [Trichonephila clavipes]
MTFRNSRILCQVLQNWLKNFMGLRDLVEDEVSGSGSYEDEYRYRLHHSVCDRGSLVVKVMDSCLILLKTCRVEEG